jgi:hypothetical protein
VIEFRRGCFSPLTLVLKPDLDTARHVIHVSLEILTISSNDGIGETTNASLKNLSCASVVRRRDLFEDWFILA